MAPRSISEAARLSAGGRPPPPARRGIIRLAGPADLDAVAALADAAFDDARGPGREELRISIGRGTVNLLEADGELQGVIILEPLDDDLFVVTLAVAPEHRRRGLGRRLIAFAEREARCRGLGSIHLYADRRSRTGLAFYERLGFRSTAEAAPGRIGGDEVPLVRAVL
ncbi:MAG TPA: GNAT family N-acetyltransferase [Geminicoccaceae bacterium]